MGAFLDIRLALMAHFLFEDLQDAICGLDPSTRPGDDDLTRESFLEHWNVLHVH